jgi:hypothetical protein
MFSLKNCVHIVTTHWSLWPNRSPASLKYCNIFILLHFYTYKVTINPSAVVTSRLHLANARLQLICADAFTPLCRHYADWIPDTISHSSVFMCPTLVTAEVHYSCWLNNLLLRKFNISHCYTMLLTNRCNLGDSLLELWYCIVAGMWIVA